VAVFPHALQPFAHELPGAIQVHTVLERHADLRKAELGERAQFHHAGKACHLAFERERDELLDFLRRKRGHGGVDLSTCGLVMSGTASIGKRNAAPTPTRTSTPAASKIAARCRSENSSR
jgi:hypothetical protein